MSTSLEPPVEEGETSLPTPENHLLEGPVLATLIKLSWPIILTNTIQSAYPLTDAFWVGRLGGNAVASISVSFPVIFLFIGLGVGFGIAGTILVAQYRGAGDQAMVNKAAGQTLLLVAVSSLLLSTLGLASASFYLDALDLKADVYGGAESFLRFALAGILFTFGFFMFQSLMRGVGEVKLPLYIVSGAVLLNFLVDPLLIFGWGPIEPMGVSGAALATLVTQGLALVLGIAAMMTGRWGIRLTWANLKPDWSFIKRALKLGLPSSVEVSSHSLGMNVMMFLITGFGTVITATYGIVINIIGLVLIPAMGLSMATTTLIGQNIGAKKVKRAVSITRLSIKLAFACLMVIGVLLFLFADHVIRFFVPHDEAVVAAGVVFLHIVSLTFGFLGAQFAITGALRAAGDTIAPMTIAILSRWVLQIPLALILSLYTSLGASGIWWSFAATHILTAVFTGIWYKSKGGLRRYA